MPQLNEGTGSYAGRRADGVAMSLWPSRGIRLHGFEIKVARGDFLSELKKPEKADAIQRFCHHWWIVTPPEIVTASDLLPSTWGHMEMHGSGLRVTRQAPETTPEPMSMTAIAAMFRAFQETVPFLKAEYVHKSEIEEQINERVREQIERRDPLVKAHEELTRRVSEFEKASGLEIARGYREPKEIGAAVQALLSHGSASRVAERLAYPATQLRQICDSLQELMSSLRSSTEEEVTA